MKDSNKKNIIILGDGESGKTSLILTYCNQGLNENHITTTGLDFHVKTFKPVGSSEEVVYKIWDTAGQERFRNLTYAFYK